MTDTATVAAPGLTQQHPLEPPGGVETEPARSRRRRRLRTSERVAGTSILLACLAASVVVPWIVPQASESIVADPLQPPSMQHMFGTDELGRDVLVRVFEAIRLDLGIALVAVSICAVFGTLLGIGIGLAPRPLREVSLRLVDAVLAVPYLIIVLGIAAVARSHHLVPFLPASAMAVFIALVVTGWITYARVAAVQAQVLVQRESIVAVRLLGFGWPRILARHVFPEVFSPNLSLAASHAVLVTAAIASLSFLGAGVAPPTAELGALIHAGIGLISSAWWVSIFPGIAIVLLGVGFSLIADSRSTR